MVIALFRHGITEANKKRAYSGWSNPQLCEKEAGMILLQQKEYEQYYSSDLTRCIQTSRCLFPGVKTIPLKELREMHFGQWEGNTYEELKENADYQRWIGNPEDSSPPGGESFKQFRKRIMRGWNEVIGKQDCKKIAIITHSGVMREFLTSFAPYPKAFWEWDTPFAAGYELVFKKSDVRRGNRCISLQVVPSTVSVRG